MSAVAMLTLFAIFGGVCGFYLSVVGFGLTSVAIALLLGIANPFFQGPFTPGFLLLAFVAQQIGYGLSVIGRGLAQSLTRRPDEPDAAAREAIPAEQDQTR